MKRVVYSAGAIEAIKILFRRLEYAALISKDTKWALHILDWTYRL